MILLSNIHTNSYSINSSIDNKDNLILDDINRIQSHKDVNDISTNTIHSTTTTSTSSSMATASTSSISSSTRIDLSQLNSNEIAILQYDSRPLSDYWYTTTITSTTTTTTTATTTTTTASTTNTNTTTTITNAIITI